MASNVLMYGDNRSCQDILKFVLNILKYENIFELGVVEHLGRKLGRRPDKRTKLTTMFGLKMI